MTGFFKDGWKLLINGGRNMLLFEILYKMIAVAAFYPLAILLINFAVKIAGVRYLTNEYIAKVITDPLVIIVLICAFLVIGTYILYEMIFISSCYEFKKNNKKVTLYENLISSSRILSRILNRKNWIMAPFTVISVLAINISGILNLIINTTTKNMIISFLVKRPWQISALVIAGVILIYIPIILGSFVMNAFILEDMSFRDSYKKSCKIVKKHVFRIFFSIVLYNVAVIVCVLVMYLVLSVFLVVGVKILDMAYIGSAVYLSSIRIIRSGVKIVLMLISVPVSYTMLSRIYYKCDEDENHLEPVSQKEKRPLMNRVVCLTVFFLAMVLNTTYVVLAFNKNPFDKVAILNDIKVTAHRGSSIEAPENTLSAFSKAIDEMADYIEFDVQQTSDGEIIVMHDQNVYRTTGVDKNVWEMTLAEISELDAGSHFSTEYSGEKVPTFEEVLKLAKGKIDLNIEIKPSGHDNGIAQKVLELVEKYDFEEHCVITSADYTTLQEVKSLNPDIPVGYILSLAYGNFYNMSDIDFFSVNASFLSKITVDSIHNSGKEVHAWTVNNGVSIKNLANKGVDNIITDEPITAQEVIYSRNTSETLVNMIKYVFSK